MSGCHLDSWKEIPGELYPRIPAQSSVCLLLFLSHTASKDCPAGKEKQIPKNLGDCSLAGKYQPSQ